MHFLGVPLPLFTDSYKTTHADLYPDATRMTAYGEFRASYDKDTADQRIVFYGMRYLIDKYVNVAWTEDDVLRAARFFETHNAGFTPFPFPKDLFLRFVRENNGKFPVRIQSLPEGSVVYPHTPVYQITAEDGYARLVTYLETILTMVWYPSTVATLSRRAKTVIAAAFDRSVDPESMGLLNSRLHDFGFRGCTCVEQSIIGGCAHLLNFEGTDTLTAAYYAQYELNDGTPVATSIPATEHSIMTSYPTELQAMQRLVSCYGAGACACVMDSYDYVRALDELLPVIAKEKIAKGGFLVLRPDSGDPVDVVLMALRACEKVFGVTVNSKGFKVINGAGVIQGDAVTYESLQKMEDAVLGAGFSAQCVAFGMGAGLLQKVNRDKMSFATKLSKIVYADGTQRDVMKRPKTGAGKISLPGEFIVMKAHADDPPLVYPIETLEQERHKNNILKTVYDSGRELGVRWEPFRDIRSRVEREWNALPRTFDPLTPELHAKVDAVLAAMSV